MARVLLFFSLTQIDLPAEELTGVVVAVHDGDTITLLKPDKKQVKIRLAGIDAPEFKQPFGTASKQALSRLVFRKQVKVIDKGTDRYKRTLGDIYEGQKWINLVMIEEGLAWQYWRYNHDSRLNLAQQKARSSLVGLWQDAEPVAPWDWRRDRAAHRGVRHSKTANNRKRHV